MFAKFLTFILAIGLSFTTLQAEEYGTLKGKITDENGEGLIGTSVEVIGKGIGAMADVNGRYEITNLLPGKYKVKISMLNYEDQFFDVEIKENQVMALDCIMKLDPTDEIWIDLPPPYTIEFLDPSNIGTIYNIYKTEYPCFW